MTLTLSEIFMARRARLVRRAYQMLGSLSEAEDIVQDAYLRWSAADHSTIRDSGAYLDRTVANLAIDRLRAARLKRETYVGPWLPEPLIEWPDDAPNPEEAAALADDVSMALLLLLERLSPSERAAFLLHEVFGYGFGEIARLLAISEEAARQNASRARRHISDGKPRYQPTAEEEEKFIGTILHCFAKGDLGAFLTMISPDAKFVSDGGARGRAALRVIEGREAIGDLLQRLLWRQAQRAAPHLIARVRINGLPGIVLSEGEKGLFTMSFEIGPAGIHGFYVMRNPDKLRHVQSRATPSA